MRLEVQGKLPVENITPARMRSAILGLRSYGPRAYASLTDSDGSYLQVGGGRQTCVLERRDALSGRHFRAYHDAPSKVFADGTELCFAGQRIKLAANEWVTADMAVEVFLAFLEGRAAPGWVKWRDITDIFEDFSPSARC